MRTTDLQTHTEIRAASTLLMMFVTAAGGCEPDYLDLGSDRQAAGATTSTETTTTGEPFCAPGESRECYTGPDGTKGQGICKAGLETCNADGTAFGSCEGETHPQTEDCATPVDEDCDGLAPPCTGVCLWSKAFGDQQAQSVRNFAVDPAGGWAVVGSFLGTIDFGAGPVTSGPGSYHDTFVAKLTSDGAPVWSKAFPCDNEQLVRAIAIDEAGSVIVAGKFTGNIDYGNGPAVSQSVEDLFVVKLRAENGAHIWSKQFASSFVGTPSVAVTSAGDVILFGTFSGNLNLGCGLLSESAGGNVFAARLRANDGACIWSESFGKASYGSLKSLFVDGSDHLILGGTFSGTLDFGGGALISDGVDVFVAKLTEDGAHVWSKVIGSSGFQAGHQVTSDKNGDVLVTGEYEGVLDLGTSSLTAVEDGDLFVVKLASTDGTPLWGRSYGDAGSLGLLAPTRSIAADSSGNVLLGGQFSGTLDFGGGPLASVQQDVYAAKLTGSGEHVWSKRFGDSDNGQGYQAATAVLADANGNMLLGGLFHGAVSFGCGPLVSSGSSDAFLVRLSP